MFKRVTPYMGNSKSFRLGLQNLHSLQIFDITYEFWYKSTPDLM